MSAGWLASAGVGAVNVFLTLALAPLGEGIIRKVTARVQSRQGPPLLQPYYDLLKLLGKEDIESGESPVVQRLAALLALGTTLSLAVLIPIGGRVPLAGRGDAILLVYMITVCGVATLLAGLAAGSPYAVVGVSRGMMSMLTLEPILVVVVIASAVRAGSLGLPAVLAAPLWTAPSGVPASGLVLLVVMLLALQAFVERVPFDIAEAETEIMEGALVEYSGPKLALFKYARSVRLLVYASLLVALFSPLGRSWDYPFGILATLGQVLVLVLLVTLVGATHARYRIDQALRYYGALLATAVVGLTLVIAGY
jgi:formate hydrogenlyase subunit 4